MTMNRLCILGFSIAMFTFSFHGFSQYNSFHGLSLHSANISQKGEVYASVNIPILYSEIAAAYAPFNNVVIQSSTNFGSEYSNTSRFNQSIGLGFVKRVKKDFLLGFRSFVGYHKFFYQDFETDVHDFPIFSTPLRSQNRVTHFCYYQYNSASIQADVTLDISSVQVYICSSLMRLNYTYLRIFNEFKNYGMEERFNFYELHHTLDVGVRYAVVNNFYLTTNTGLRSLIRESSQSKSQLKSQTFDLYFLNFGLALKLESQRNQEKQKSE